MKKIVNVNFADVARPIWRAVKRMGLSAAEIDELIEEARARTRSRERRQ
jgi:hypothetical protein